jgi:membrane-associated phospholipid phosphatase
MLLQLHRARQSGRNLVVLGGLALVLLSLTYVVMVRTDFGQTFGDSAYLGRLVESKSARETARGILNVITGATIVLMLVVLVVIGLLRRQILVASVAGGCFFAAIAAAEVLKRVLSRPEISVLEASTKFEGFNTFPSGHASIATGFAIALLFVSSPRWRPTVALAGAVWVSLVCSGTLAAGWHRPSDAVGGVALATGVMGIGGGLLVSRRFVLGPVMRTAGVILPGAAFVFLVVSASLLASITHFSSQSERPGYLWWAFPLASLTIDAVAISAVCTFAWLMTGVIVRPAASSEPATVTSSPPHSEE